MVKNLPTNAEDTGSIPGLGRSPGGRNGSTLKCSFLENPWAEKPGELQSIELQSKEGESESHSVVSNSLGPYGLLQSMVFSRPEYWSGYPFSSPGNLLNPGIECRSLTLQVDSLPAEPQGKSKNTGVGSLSLLQGIFPTQEFNWGLPHCRWILLQLSYQESK